MQTEPISVEMFVKLAFNTARVGAVTNDWSVEAEALQKVAIALFREMGVYQIHPDQHDMMIEALIGQLLSSAEVKTLIRKGEVAEKQRMRTRHADP